MKMRKGCVGCTAELCGNDGKYRWLARLFEDLALVEFSAVLIFAFLDPVLFHQGFRLITGRIKLLPVIAIVINLPILAQIEAKFLLSPKRHTDAKPFFFIFSNRWNIPPIRLQDMKVN